MCIPTEYAIKRGAFTNNRDKVDGKATCHWWLRSPGTFQTCAAFVNTTGSRLDNYVDRKDYAVRPAIWVDLGSGVF